VWNSGFQAVLFWDGRAASLEEQAAGPPLNPKEMGMPSVAAVEQRVKDNPSYREPFARAFGTDQPITIKQITAAIAAYERTLITTDTPYDRFVRGDEKAFSQLDVSCATRVPTSALPVFSIRHRSRAVYSRCLIHRNI
jgi:cytochrome c peroxidase